MTSVTTSTNGVNGGGGGGGIMENMMAMQSVQAMQSILNSKEGWTKHNLIAFAIMLGSDAIKRVLNSSVDTLLNHRFEICVYVAKLLRNGWRTLWAAIVYVVKLRFLRSFYSKLSKLSHRPSRLGTEANEEDDKDKGYQMPVVTIDLSFKSTLHEWRSLLSSPDMLFRKKSKITTERLDVFTTIVSETLVDVTLDAPQFVMQPKTSLLAKWSVTRHPGLDEAFAVGVTFDKELLSLCTLSADVDDESYNLSNLRDLSGLLPYSAFYDRTKTRAEYFTYWDSRGEVYIKGTTYSSHMECDFANWLTVVFSQLEQAGMSFENQKIRTRCFGEVAYILLLAAGEAGMKTEDVSYTVRGKLFGVNINVNMDDRTTCKSKLYVPIRIESDYPNASDMSLWLKKCVRFYQNGGSDTDNSATKETISRSNGNRSNGSNCSAGVRESEISASSSGMVELTLATKNTGGDNRKSGSAATDDISTLLDTWNAYVSARETAYDHERKTNLTTLSSTTTNGRQNNRLLKYKTYALRVHEREVTSTEPNPEYARYQEKKRVLEELIQRKKPDTDGPKQQQHQQQSDRANGRGGFGAAENALAQLVCSQPDEQVVIAKSEKYVEREYINDFRRDLASLYLREEDAKTLSTCMYNFKHNRHVLADVGIPNKLGVMLNGPPGTGKTSTLAAIATYLEKDLYYLHLNDLRTNADLKCAFDFVFKTCAEGGVIVMEDVDAMSNVVKRRKNGDEDRANHANDVEVNAEKHDPKGRLTLEFFLNLLQGTLTLDGCIFVATTNHLEVLDPAFYRRGRFDVIIEMGAADAYQIGNMYRRFFSRDVPASLLSRIPEHVYTPAEFVSHFAQYLLRSELVDDETVLTPFLRPSPCTTSSVCSRPVSPMTPVPQYSSNT